MSEPGWVSGARIVVTGAAGALGRGLVEEAARQGAVVTATGREPTIDSVEFPAGVHVLPADLADPHQCRDVIARAVELMGGIDVLINNAAVLIRERFADLGLDDLERAWAVNLRAPVLLMQAALPHLERGNSPAIVNVVSSAGVSGGVAPVSAYAMTKAGLIVVSKAVAREFGALGIRVNCVSPPTLDSQMQASLDREERAKVRGLNVLGRAASVEEVARIVLFVASPYASFVTGTTVDATALVP
jgi:NAD(P)-dependent dehydrogenase (short-subunit alcohol dehydrogenase family)